MAALYPISSPALEAAYMPLRHWDDAALVALARLIEQACVAWSRQWLGARAVPGAARAQSCILERTAKAPEGLILHGAGAPGRAWLSVTASPALRAATLRQMVARMLFDDANAAGTPIAGELSAAAAVALLRTLAGACGLIGDGAAEEEPPSALPTAAFLPWAGGVRVSLPLPGELSLYLDGACVAPLLPRANPPAPRERAPLTTVTQAAERRVLFLEARLRGAELTLGHLKSLAIGDVIVLPHLLEEPLMMVAPRQSEVCRAFLGRSGGRRAVELAHRDERAHPATHETNIVNEANKGNA